MTKNEYLAGIHLQAKIPQRSHLSRSQSPTREQRYKEYRFQEKVRNIIGQHKRILALDWARSHGGLDPVEMFVRDGHPMISPDHSQPADIRLWSYPPSHLPNGRPY
jgi:hypothetical protein